MSPFFPLLNEEEQQRKKNVGHLVGIVCVLAPSFQLHWMEKHWMRCQQTQPTDKKADLFNNNNEQKKTHHSLAASIYYSGEWFLIRCPKN